jgi:hypothetical protein
MNCAYHPDRQPVGACVACGRLICVECKALLGGKMYCTPCADKIFVNKGTEPIAKTTAPPPPKRIAADTAQPPKNPDQSPVEVKKIQTEDEATRIRKAKANAYASRCRRGLLGLIVGVVITVVSHSYDVIPVTVTAYGIMLVGAYWFISGFFGWLTNRG